MQLVHPEAIIKTERLLLEPLKKEHAIALYSLLQDTSLYQYIPQKPPISLKALEQRYQNLETRLSPDESEAWLNWAIWIEEREIYGGFIEITVSANYSGQIAYMLSPLFWGQGYAFEACRHLIINVWQNYHITEMIAEVDTRNLASIRLLERLGFVNVETRKDVDFFKGSQSHEYIYQLSSLPLYNLKSE